MAAAAFGGRARALVFDRMVFAPRQLAVVAFYGCLDVRLSVLLHILLSDKIPQAGLWHERALPACVLRRHLYACKSRSIYKHPVYLCLFNPVGAPVGVTSLFVYAAGGRVYIPGLAPQDARELQTLLTPGRPHSAAQEGGAGDV